MVGFRNEIVVCCDMNLIDTGSESFMSVNLISHFHWPSDWFKRQNSAIAGSTRATEHVTHMYLLSNKYNVLRKKDSFLVPKRQIGLPCTTELRRSAYDVYVPART